MKMSNKQSITDTFSVSYRSWPSSQKKGSQGRGATPMEFGGTLADLGADTNRPS